MVLYWRISEFSWLAKKPPGFLDWRKNLQVFLVGQSLQVFLVGENLWIFLR
jgi:hypothetical protein